MIGFGSAARTALTAFSPSAADPLCETSRLRRGPCSGLGARDHGRYRQHCSPCAPEPRLRPAPLADAVVFSTAARVRPAVAAGPSELGRSTPQAFRRSRNSLASPAYRSQLFHCRFDADALGPSRDLPDSPLEPFQSLWRNRALDVRTSREAEPKELPFLRSRHRALCLVHFELQLLCDESFDALHHPQTRPFAADVDIGIVRISHEAVSAALQLAIEFIEHDVAQQWHDVIGEPTLGDAILDRIVHNAYRLELDGPSMRKIKAAETSEPAATTATDDKPKGAKK